MKNTELPYNTGVAWTVVLCLIAMAFISALTGCYTQKKATEQVEKANDKFPAVVAKMARDKYPCKDLLKPDTTTIYQDSIILVEIECPDVPTEVIRVDTVNNVITRTVRVPVNMPVQTRYITKWYQDSAAMYLLTKDLETAKFANTKLSDENNALSKKVARKSKENWIWRIIALILIGWTVFRFWNKITTFKIKQI